MFKNDNQIILNSIKLLLGLLLISFTGIRYASDTDVSYLFIKNKPTLKFEYHPPIGIYESVEALPEKTKQEYHKYTDVVAHRNLARKLDRFALFIVVLATVLMTSGLVGLMFNKKTKEIKLLLLDYFMQFGLALVIGGLYRPDPIRNPQFDGRLLILLFFLLSIGFDCLARTALTNRMLKEKAT
jgi:hypothetical protein